MIKKRVSKHSVTTLFSIDKIARIWSKFKDLPFDVHFLGSIEHYSITDFGQDKDSVTIFKVEHYLIKNWLSYSIN